MFLHSGLWKSCVEFVARVFWFAIRFLFEASATLRLNWHLQRGGEKRGTKGGSVAKRQHNLVVIFIDFLFLLHMSGWRVFVCMSVGLLSSWPQLRTRPAATAKPIDSQSCHDYCQLFLLPKAFNIFYDFLAASRNFIWPKDFRFLCNRWRRKAKAEFWERKHNILGSRKV